ncbi:hypothetical protein TSMEX_011496 [Taenia solium]|eukprot:TsM_000244500 transcript=TsM_000244500 gene=TsM_000244500
MVRTINKKEDYLFSDVGEHPYEATSLPPKEVEGPSTKVLETGATRLKVDEFQQPQKVETDSDDRARADSFDENVSTTFTDLRLDNNGIPESLTDVTGVQRLSSDQGVKAVEVQLPSDSEIRVPVRIERVNLNDGGKESILSSLFYAYTNLKNARHRKLISKQTFYEFRSVYFLRLAVKACVTPNCLLTYACL